MAYPRIAVGAGVAIFAIATILSCSRQPTSDPHPPRFVGKWVLHVGSNQLVRKPDLVSSALQLTADGTSQLDCDYDGGRFERASGTWELQGNRLWVDPFIDCAGVWPERGGPRAGAQLLVEESKPPVVLLSPDVNVFYEHE